MTFLSRAPLVASFALASLLGARAAAAQSADPPPPVAAPVAPPVAAPVAPAVIAPVAAVVNVPANAPATPTPNAPSRALFSVDPVTDGAILAIGGGFAILSDQIVGTGEISPQQIRKNFDPSSLIAIDRIAVTQTLDPNAARNSNIGLGVSVAYAVLDPIFSGLREHSLTTTIVDLGLYGESLALTEGVTNLAKLAVRRPRPIAYKEAAAHANDPNYSNTSTDSSLSFFSGHASTVGAIGATATYLSFARSPHSFRPWVTLGVSVAMATFVDIERVRAGAHFPTDVLCGTLAGAGIGTLVVHFHSEGDKAKAYFIGWQSPAYGDGGEMTLSGRW